ncbi:MULTISPECIES: hypothetical protein [unclassified Brevundimonas]|uniref:hypothetical protein n=1 Tax=unclassified Brevundimonas TaxID=2622653 RepID=UPI0025B8E3C9|nr:MULTISPECIES: hypothetical protein [unclassified Brevundimonas]
MGRVLVGIGVALTLWAFFMPVAVIEPLSGDVIANNDLLNQRLLFALTGGGTFVGGWLAMILDALQKRP